MVTAPGALDGAMLAAGTAGPIVRRRQALDPAQLVWEPEAFRGFLPSADYERTRAILGGPARQDWDDRPDGDTPRLAGLQCGAPDPVRPDRRCGLTLTAMRTEGADYAYTSARCSSGERGHRTSVRRHIEVPVLEMLAEAYTPEAMAAAVRAVVERADVARQRLAALDRQLKLRDDDYARATYHETEALRAQHRLNIQHWGAQRLAAQEARNALLQERAAFVQSLAEYAPVGGLEPQLALVREVAGDAGALLTRAARHPEITRALVRALTRALAVYQVAPSVVVLEVEYPNGARARRVVLVGSVACTQPERVLAHAAFARAVAGAAAEGVTGGGDALTATAERLTRANDKYGPRILFTPDKVRTLALLHRFFETVAPRVGPLESAAGVAARVGVEEDEAVARVLDGRLGPAGVTPDGALAVAPTAEELEAAFPAYAACETERREDWDADEAIDMRRLRPDYGVSATEVARWVSLEMPGRSAHDLAGRRYVRRSAVPRLLLTRSSPAADRAAFRAAARRALDAAGYEATAVDDWWVFGDLLRQLRTNTRVGSAPGLRTARARGLVHTVPYRGPHSVPGNNPPGFLVYCPAEVADSLDPAMVRAWFKGRTPAPPRTPALDGAVRGEAPSPAPRRSRRRFRNRGRDQSA